MSPHAFQTNENKVDVCFKFNLHKFLLSLGKGFTAQFHQTSFHPNTVVSPVPHGFLGESQNTFHFSPSLCLPPSLLFHSIYYFFYSALLQIKDATASSHSTSVTIMCDDHDCISPEHIGHSPGKKSIFRYYKCALY